MFNACFHEGQECQVEIRGITAFCLLGNTADCHAVDRVWNVEVASNFWKHHFLLISPESAWKIEHGENLQTVTKKYESFRKPQIHQILKSC